MKYLGWPSLCIRVKDIETSKRFYMKAGMNLISEVTGMRAILGFGSFRLALMNFLDENLINIRGGDVFAAYEELHSEFPDIEGVPERYTAEQYDADADGAGWSTRDPDGNVVLFDTNENEMGSDYLGRRTSEILDGAVEELKAIGAEPTVLSRLEEARKSIST
jgi:catechol 2,3-dioxygenase-like lactoylglutathione lyase family enzyme